MIMGFSMVIRLASCWD